MPKKTTWICDACGKDINTANEGWVEWLERPTKRDGRDVVGCFRIVHHPGISERPTCQAASSKVDGTFHLHELQGPDGLMRLLECLAKKRFTQEELLELIKRIHIPNYEQARRHFKAAYSDDVIERDVAWGYWPQSDLKRVLAYARTCKE